MITIFPPNIIELFVVGIPKYFVSFLIKLSLNNLKIINIGVAITCNCFSNSFKISVKQI